MKATRWLGWLTAALFLPALLHAERIEFRGGAVAFALPRVDGVVLRHHQPGGRVIVQGQDGATIRVEIDPPGDDDGVFVNALQWDAARGTVTLDLTVDSLDCDLRIWVPRSLALELSLVDGDLWIDEVSGPIEVHSVDGDVRINGASEAVLVESTDGDVIVVQGNAHPTRPIALGTVDGDVRLIIPSGFTGVLDMSTTEGEIHFTTDGRVKTLTEPRAQGGGPDGLRRQVIELNGGGARVQLYTIDGRITVASP